MYKRRLQRTKAFNVTKWKFHLVNLAFTFLLLCTFLTFLHYPTTKSGALSKWVYGSSDPRYLSHLVVDWKEISRVLDRAQNKVIKHVGLLNFNDKEIHQWKHFISHANHTRLHLDYVDPTLKWEALFPEWIDEEQDEEIPICPSLPAPQVPQQRLDLIAVKLPCREGNWSRDIARLHLQISAAKLAGFHKGSYPVHLLFITNCFPLPNLFHCRDLVARQGNAWLYNPNLGALREKLRLPIGSCELSFPLGDREVLYSRKKQREAYATILHSNYVYVCGAIAVAQSIKMSGSTRDLVILVDKYISDYHRRGLEMAGWQVRTIDRIRNPKAEKDSYNEWNYSKFRLWQLTDYDKIIFIDSDMLILRNIDFLFGMPELSATGNHEQLFNSGVMVIEPSNCTFQLLMANVDRVESYNGGDQGFLNEIMTWWHRIPKHMNFLKHVWVGDDEIVRQKKMQLFEAEPPVLYVVHYLGNKPWMCFRDYDCNWNVELLREFASDAAHWQWWRVHDAMPEKLQEFCLMRALQKAQLEWDRREAEKGNFSDGHWRLSINDERLETCIDEDCDWEERLRHWGKKTAA